MKSEFVIEFESAEEMKEFIAKINPVIKIAYSESKEIEDFRQKLLSLQSENNELRAAPAAAPKHKYIETLENIGAVQAATFTPQEKYEKKADKLHFSKITRTCENHHCNATFFPDHNRVKFCADCRSKKVKKPVKTPG